MKLSIIIVSWNVRDDLLGCLASIEKHPPKKDYEVIVVDNASADGSATLVQKEFPSVKVIANKVNRGFSAANNQGIAAASGQYLFLLNPDTIAHPHAMDNLIKVLDENPKAALCGPKLINEKGETWPSAGFFPTFRSLLYSKTFLRRLGIFRRHYKKLSNDNFNYDKQSQAQLLSGAAVMVRKTVMEQINGMDESFFLYYEDTDLCLRIKKAGYELIYVPQAVVTHLQGKSSEQISAKKKFVLCKSLLVYVRKHFGRLEAALFGLLFKPSVIIKEILTLFSSSAVCLISFLLRNNTRKHKSLQKMKNSASLLGKYSWQILFRI